MKLKAENIVASNRDDQQWGTGALACAQPRAAVPHRNSSSDKSCIVYAGLNKAKAKGSDGHCRRLLLACCLPALFLSACGRQGSTTASTAPTRAFVASDFDNNAAPDLTEIEVPIVVRDPFQIPNGLSTEEQTAAPVRWTPSVEHVPAATAIPLSVATAQPQDEPTTEEPQPIEVIWPDIIRFSGVLRDEQGRWMAAIDGNVIREGEWLTPDVRLAHADQDGAVFIHRSGATRRINVIDRRENG